MENQNQNRGTAYTAGDGVNGAVGIPVAQESDIGSEALSTTPIAEAFAAAPLPKRKSRTWILHLSIVLAIVLSLGFVLTISANKQRSGAPTLKSVGGQFDTVEIPLDDLEDTLTGGSRTAVLTINGDLRLNGGLTLAPSAQPTDPQLGQLYLDELTSVLSYFNGEEFVEVGGNGTVEEIGGLRGQIALGGGLGVVGNQLVNQGVLSFGGRIGSIAVGTGLVMNGNTLQNDGIVSVVSSSPGLTVVDDGSGNLTLGLAGAGTGTVASSGGTPGRIAKFTGVQQIEDSLLSEAGAVVTVNGDLSVTGTVTLSSALSVANGGTGATSLASNGVLVGNGVGTISSIPAGAPGQCFTSTLGVPAWTSCTNGSNAVTSLNGLTGALTVANATGLVNTITIDDASTANKGIVQFNGTNFSVAGGVANTIQNINTGASPTFSSLTLSGDIAVNGGDITSTGALNITPAGTLTAGSTNQTVMIQGNSSSVFTATNGGNTTTLSFQAPTANVTYRFPTAAAGSYDVCTTASNCSAVVDTLQTAYNNSTDPEIVVDGTRGAVTIRDNSTPIAANLLEVQNNAGGTTYLAVSASGTTITQGLTLTGTTNINTSGTAATSFGNSTGTLTVTGNSSSTFVLNGVTVDANEFNRLDTKDAALVDTNDAVNTAITGTGALNSGSITSGFGAIDTGADNITTTGTLQGTTSVLSQSFDRTSAGALNIGSATATSIVLGQNTSLTGAATFTSGTGTVLLQGNTDVANTVSLATNRGATYTTAGSANDVALNVASLYVLDTSGAAQTITGIAAGRDGQYLTLVNGDAALAVTLSNNSGSSLAANRISTGTGVNLSLPAGASINLIYDTTSSLWRVVGTAPGGGGCPTCANQQLSNLSGTNINTALNATSTNLDLTTTTSGNIVLNSAGTIELQDNTNVTGTLGVSSTLTVTAGGLTVSAGGANIAGNTTIATTAGNTLGLGNSTGTLTVTGNSSSTFVINGVTVDASEFNRLDGKDAALVDTNDAVNTAITGTGALNSGSITSGFGAIDTGADNITTTGTVQGTTSVLTQSLDRTSAGALNIGASTATSIVLGQNTSLTGAATLTSGTGTVLLQGNTDIENTVSLATKRAATYTTAGSANDVALNVASLYVLDTSGAAQTITGIAAGRDGQLLTLVNGDAALAVTLSNNSGSSSAANRITTGTGSDIQIPAGGSLALVYDTASNLWRVVGGVAGGSGSCPTCANQQLSNLSGTNINTALNATAANLDLTTTTSGNIVLNSAGTIELQDNTNITGTLGVSSTLTVTAGGLTVSAGGASIAGNTTIATTAGNTLGLGNSTGTLTVTGNSSSTFVINGVTVDATEFSRLDGKDAALVDTNDAVNTAITGTGALGSGSITSGFGSIDTGADNITTTGTLQGTTSVLTQSLDRTSAGALNIGSTTATSIVLGQNTSLTGASTFTSGTGTVLLQGNTDVAATVSLATKRGTTYTTAGSANDVALNVASLYILDTSGAAQTITGIAAGRDGQQLTLVNGDAALDVTLSNNSGSSSAANRITTGTGADVTIAAGGSITLIYDTASSLWRVVGGVAGGSGSCPTCANTALSNLAAVNINTALNATSANLNLTTTTSGNIVLNSAGTIELQDNTNVTGTLGVSSTLTVTSGGLTVSAGGASIAGNTTIATTAGNTLGLGNNTGALTVTGSSSSTFVLDGATVTTAEFNLLDGHDVALVDTNDAVNTAITGTGALNSGSITSGFGTIDTGADNITTTGTLQGTTSVLTQSLDRTSAGALTIGASTATSIVLGQNTSLTGAATLTSGTGTVLLQGNTDVAATVSLAARRGATYTTAGSANDVALNVASLYILDTSGAAQTITGIAAGRDGQLLTLVNGDAALAVTLSNNSGSSSAANRITTGTGSDVTLTAGATIELVYDTNASLWRVVGSVAGGGGTCGTCANQQLSNLSSTNINTALNATSGNLDLTTTTSGNIVLNSAGTIELQDNTNVTGTLGASSTLTVTSGGLTVSAGGASIAGNTTIATTAGNTLGLGNSTGTLTVTGNSSTTFVINGVTVDATEFSRLDGKDAALVDTNDAVNTAITGTGALGSGSITSGFGSIDTGADNITTTGTLQGTTSVLTQSLDRTSAGALNIGSTTATSIVLGQNTSLTGAATFTSGTGTVLLQGNTDVANTVSLATRRAATYTTAGSANDVALNVASLYILDTSGAAQTITGIAAGRDGQHLTLVNADASLAVTLSNLNGGSSAANQISTGVGTDVTITAGASIDLIYDTSASLWRVIGGVAGGAGTCPTCANQQLSNLSSTNINTALNATSANLNLTTTTSGNIVLNSAGTIELQDNTNVTGTLGVSSTLTVTTGGLTVSAGGASIAGNTTIATTAGNTLGLGNSTGALTVTGSSSSTFVINGVTVDATEFNRLDGKDAALVDTNDAVSTAITGTGALGSGSITSGFGSIDTGADNITTTGTLQGTTSVLTQSLDRTSAGALNIGASTATSIVLGQNTSLTGAATFTSGTGTVLLQGNTDIAATVSLATRRGTTYTTAGSANDVALNVASLYVLDTSGAAQTITGIAAGRDGQYLTLVNGDAALAVTLSNNSGSSSAANRITTGTGADLSLSAGASVILVYDTASSLWRVVGGAAGAAGTCPTCANQQLSNLSGTNINTALNATSANLDLTTTTSGNIVLNSAGTIELQDNTTITGAATFTSGTGTVLLQGNTDIANTVSLATKRGSTYTTAGSANDVALNVASLYILDTSGAAQTITGIAAGRDGQYLTLVNGDAALAVTLSNNSGSSSAANRITTGTGADISVPAGGSAILIYDTASSLWRVVGGVAGGAGTCAGCANTALSNLAAVNINTALNATSANLDLTTTTSGNIVLNSAGTIELQDNTNITGAATFTSGTGTVLLQGNTDIAATVSLATKRGTTYTTAGSANDVAINVASLYVLDTSGAAQTVTGIAAGRDGQYLTLVNGDAALAVTLSNNSGSSSAANRITTGTGADLSLAAGASATLVYDTASSLWRVVGGVAGGAGTCPTCANQQLSNLSGTNINTALNATSANLDLTTTTSGNIVLNSAGTIELQDNTNVTGTLGVSSTLTVTTGGLTVSAGGANIAGNTTIATTAGNTLGLGNSTGTLTVTGNSSSTFVINGVTVDATEFNRLDGKDAALVDTNDAVTTAITGTGALGSGSITSGFGSIDTGADNITTTGTLQGTTSVLTQSLDRTSAGALNIGSTTATSIVLGQNTSLTGAATFTSGTGTVLLQGNTDVAATVSLAAKRGTTYTTAGSANDVAINVASLYILDTSGAAQTITGIAAGRDGQLLTLVNGDAALAVTLSNNSGSSSAANRISTGTGADISLAAGASINLVYDTASSLWRVVGGVAGGAGTCAGCANTALSNLAAVNINTALNATSANLNLTTTTSGNIVLNSAGTIELQDNTNVTGTLGVSSTLTVTAGGASIAGNTTIATTAGNTLGLGNSTGTLTVTGSSSSTFVINGVTVDATEFNRLDGKDAALVDTNDAVNTAITGTGALGSGSITSGFGSIDTGADNITTTGTLQGTTSVLTQSLDRTSAGALNIGASTATSIVLGQSTSLTGAATFTSGTGTVLLQGNTDIAATVSLATKRGTTYTTAGSANDVALNVASLYILDTSGAAQTITGIAAGRDGQILTLINGDAALAATLSNNSGSSSAANRITTGTGADLSLSAGASVTLVYDTASSLWRVVGGVAGGTCGTCANQQLSNLSSTNINTALNATSGNLNLTTTTSGNIVLNSAGTIELQDNTNVTGTLGVSSTLTVTAGGASIAGNTTIATTAGNTLGLGNSTGTLTVTGSSSSTFVINGVTVDATEFNRLDGKDAALVDTNDAVNTAITGTGALNAGSITSGFGSIDTGADNITTTGTLQGTTSVLTQSLDRTSAGALNIGASTATSIVLGQNTSLTGAATFTSGTGTVLLQGNTDVAATVSLATKRGATYTTAGSANDVALNVASLYVLDTSGAAQTITGIAAGRDGQYLTLVNGDAALAVTLSNNSGSSSAANRISTGTGADLSLPAGASINLIYDTASSLWRVLGGVAGGTCSTCANQQLSNLSGTNINAALNATSGNLNLTTTTSGNIVLNSAGTIELQDNTNVTGTLGVSSTLTVTSGGLTVSAGGASIAGNTTIATTAGNTLGLGNSTGALTVTGNSSSTFVINGVTVDATEFNRLDGKDAALVDTNDAVATAITGTGALNAGSITSGFGAIDTGADNITTTGTLQGTTSVLTQSLDRTSAGALNIGATTATSIVLGQNTSLTGAATFTSGTGTVLLQGNTDVAATVSLATKRAATYTTAGSANDVALNVASLYILDTSGAAQTITGIAAGRDGQHLTLINGDAALAVTLSNNSGSSSAANRITTGTGADVSLAAGASVTLIYDTASSLWRVVGGVAGGAGTCAGCANTALSNLAAVNINTALNATSANLNLTTTTSGNIVLNSAGTIELQDNTNVTGTLGVSSTLTVTTGGLTVSAGGASIAGNTTIATTAGNTLGLGNSTGALTVTGNSSSTFVINGVTVDATEFNRLDGKDAALVDTNDAVATAITGTGALNAGSITSGFGSIDTGADNITTTGTVQGTTSVLTQSLDRTSAGALNIGTTTATSIVLGQSTSLSGAATFTSGTGTVLLQGNTDIAATASLATKRGTTYTTAGSANDVAINVASLYVLDTSGAAQTITGILAGRDGQYVTFVNGDAALAVTLSNNSGSSSAANRITTGTGADISLPAGASTTLVYDTAASLWRVVGGAAGGSCSTCANQQLSNLSGTNINAALNATSGNLNLTTTTSGNIVLNSAGTIELQDNTNVTGSSTFTVGTGLTTLGGGLTASGGAIQLNVSGTANTSIGNSSGTFALISSGGLNVTTGGALTGVSTITTSGAINSQTISATANLTGTLTVANNLTLTAGDIAVNGGDITSTGALNITPGGTLTAGATTQTLTLQGNGSTTLTSTVGANTTTIAFTSPTANATLNFPALSAGTYNICTSSGNCAAAGVTLQNAYTNSSNPEIVVDATRGALTVRDNATPIAANLLEVQNNTGSTTYFAVTAAGVQTTGTNISSGNVNTTGGTIQTNNVDRISNGGNLVNIGTLTLSGAISGGTTVSGSGNFNTTGGTIQTNSTDRISNGGNLVNIGTITTSGAINSQTISSTANFTGTLTVQGGTLTVGTTSQQGSLVLHDGNGQTATISVGSALAASTALAIPTAVGATDTVCLLTLANCVGTSVTSIGAINSQAKSANGAVIASNQLVLQTADASFPGLVSTGSQTFAGNKTFTGQLLQNSDSASAFVLMDASATYNNLTFDSTTNHLRLYDHTAPRTGYIDLNYSAGVGSITTSSGTLQLGSGSGDVNVSLTNNAEKFNFVHTGTNATSSDTDFLIQRNLTGTTNNLQGAVMKIEDLSTFTSGSSAPDVLSINQSNTGATGNLIVARLGGGANDKFKVSTAGTVTIAANQSYTGAGAVTVSSATSSNLTLQATSARIMGVSAATFQSVTNSTSAFQVANVLSASILNVDTTNTALTVSSVAAASLFSPKVDYTTASSPRSITAADLDKDGDIDLAMTNHGSTSLSVFLNNGNGTYAAKVDYTTVSGPRGITAADFDKDGDIDLAIVSDGSTTMSVFMNTGAGAFAAKVDYTAGSFATGITNGDFDKDGDIDLAITNNGSTTMSVYMNTGAGAFAAKVDYTTGTSPQGISAADFDKDGDLDLAVANSNSTTMSIFMNNGNGTYAAKVDYTTGTNPRYLAAADLDKDGDIDLAVTNGGSNTMSVFMNTGTGAFAAKVDYTTGTNPLEITAADLDKDGDIDLAAANNGSSAISVFMNNGNGTYASRQSYTTTAVTYGIAAADLDKDGDLDLAATNWSGTSISVFLNATLAVSPVATPTLSLYTGGVNDALQIRTADDKQLFKVDARGNTTIGNATPGSGILFSPKVDYTTASQPYGITSADLNNDGNVDLAVVANNAATVSVFLNNGNGTYAAKVDYATGTNPRGVTAADLDKDGDIDLAVANHSSTSVSVFMNSGTGTFAGRVDYATATNPDGVTAADLDKDGDVDLAVTNNGSTSISVFLNTGVGAFAAKVDYTVGTNPYRVTAADLDKDGDIDLIATNNGSTSVSVLMNNGNGTYAAKVDYTTGTNPRAVTAADLDKDGDIDLAVTNNSSASVSVFLNTGAGAFAAKVDYATGTSPYGVTAADLDKDGDIDLATANNSSANAISVLLGTGTGTFATKIDYTAGSFPIDITSADLDKDGDIDLAVANESLSSAGVSILKNTTFSYSRLTVLSSDGSASALSVDSTGSAASTWSSTSSSLVIQAGGTGGTTIKSAANTDTTTAFQVQNIAGRNLLNVDTTNNALTVSSVAAASLFAPKVDYATANNPHYVAAADLDKDGDVDLAVPNSSSTSVSVFLNTGAGAYAPKVDYTTGTTPVAVAAADFDKDGDVDLVVTNQGAPSISVFMNSGTGTFAAKVDYTTGTGPQAVTVADLDKDGDVDIATGNSGTTTLSVFINNGAGVFAAKVDYTTGTNPFGITSADLDRDGDVDLVATNFGSTSVSVLMNNGAGVFAAKVDYTTGTNPLGITSADLDKDGDIDLAVANTSGSSNSVSVLLNNGNGTFATKVDYTSGSSSPYAITSGDLDKDGDIDLAATIDTGSSTVFVLANNGNGTFAAKVGYSVGNGAQGVAAADLDKDGDIDLVTVGNNPQTISVLLNATLSVSPVATPTLSLYTGGVNDALQIKTADDKQVFKVDARGNTTIGSTASTTSTSGGTLFAPKVDYGIVSSAVGTTAADFNKDGNIDLAVTNSSGMAVFLNNGNGTYAAKVDYTTGPTPYGITAVDLDKDGDIDLAVTNRATTTMSVFLNTGAGAFAAKVDYTTGSSPAAITSADLDKDGDIDLAVTNFGSTSVSVFLNTGAGAFAAKVDYTTGTNPEGITSADLDKDGDIDLAVTNRGSTSMSVFLNTGAGAFAAKVDYTTGTTPYAITSADLDKDGDIDLAVANNGSTTMSVFLNTGAGAFAAKVDYTTGASPQAITSVDLDKDGNIDLAVANNGSDTMSVFLNTGAGAFAAKVDYATGSAPTAITSADLDKDGDIDLAVTNQTSGSVSVFKNTTYSDSAFKVLSGDGVAGFSVDTISSRVYIGNREADATGALLVLDTKNTTGDPTGTNGGMYYNSVLHSLRCYRDGAWSNCAINEIDHVYNFEDDFMSGTPVAAGATNITGVGNLGWNVTATTSCAVAYNQTGPALSHDHPGTVRLTTAAVAANGCAMTQGGTAAGTPTLSNIIAADDVLKTAVAVGAATGSVRVGLTNSVNDTAPTSGVWWEAVNGTDTNWRYCYANNAAATCADNSNATPTITANTWVKLEIRIISATAVDFIYNGTKVSLTGITFDLGATNKLGPAYTCFASTTTAQNCYMDYFQWRGVITTAGGR